MRIVRALTALFVALIIGTSLLAVLPAQASGSAPTRVITADKTAKTYRSFRLTGNVEAFPDGRARLQKKACRSCGFKTVKKVRTSSYGNYSAIIYAPPGKGTIWKWRLKVKAQDGYATSYSPKFATFNR